MPRKSSTPEVRQAARVSFAIEAMTPRQKGGKGLRPVQCNQAIQEAFSVCERTAWLVIAAANELLSKAFTTDVPMIKSELADYYRRLMALAEETGDIRGGTAAGQALAKLTGADAPSKVEHSGNAGVLVVGAQETD